MDSNLPAPAGETGLTLAGGDDPAEPLPVSAQRPGQNFSVALLPLAIISLLVISFVAAAWTFLAAIPGS